jgi:hypothetical protein
MQDEIQEFLDEIRREVHDRMVEAGEAGVEFNVANGDYKDHTYNLRRSNYYEVREDGLVIGNSADYADYVESKGYMVCTGGALLAERILNGD